MKRFLLLLLAVGLCLSGCGKKKAPQDIPGGETAPEGVDWQLWDTYTPATLLMGREAVDVLIGLDEIHVAVYYDRQEQQLLGSCTIPTPLSDVEYSRERLRLQDKNGDGYDDIGLPDMLDTGDRMQHWWLWDPEEEQFVYSPDNAMLQQNISADITWQKERDFTPGTLQTPDGPVELLVAVEGDTVSVYRDAREQQLLGTAKIPATLSREAREYLQIYAYWDCVDVNGDGWGDLQLPYRWEETQDGSLYVYHYVWLWEDGVFTLDRERSNNPAV